MKSNSSLFREKQSPTLKNFALNNILCVCGIIIFSLSAVSCQDKDADSPAPKPDNHAVFNTAVTGYDVTRASGSQWDNGDRIGVFMVRNGDPLSSSTVLADNKKHIFWDNDIFIPDGQTNNISLPGFSCDFISYYPHKSDIQNYIYKIDLTDQSSQEAIDLLYSDNVKGITDNQSPILLSFSHQLTKLKLNLNASDESVDITGASAVIHGMKTKGDFNLADGEMSIDPASGSDISAKIRYTATGAVAEAMLLPEGVVNGVKVTITTRTNTYTWDVPAGSDFKKGDMLAYSITLKPGSTPPIVEPTIKYMELPAGNKIANTVTVTHMLPVRSGRNYSMLYDTEYKISYWVAYPLNPGYIGNNVKRSDDWNYDPAIPRELQVNLSSSYSPTNMDRGHQMPSADRLYSRAENASTFYYTNMTPQNSTLNQGQWANLEEKVRTWSKECDTLYVVTGAMIPDNKNSIEWVNNKTGQRTAKPTYYFKALAKRTNAGDVYYTAAFKYNNEPPTGTIDSHRMTVKELETLTGFTFFPGIPESTKSVVDANRWK